VQIFMRPITFSVPLLVQGMAGSVNKVQKPG